METKKICIIGCCRDVEPHLPMVLSNLDTIYSWWQECKIVLFENDSYDNTPQIIKGWIDKKGGHRQLVQEILVHARYPERTQRLAYIRNRLLHFIPPEFDYVMMIDLDDIFTTPVQKSSFDSCFAIEDTWDMITANGYEGYYDIWPLRISGWIETDCWEEYYKGIREKGVERGRAQYEYIEYWKDHMRAITEPIPVLSAFNTAMICKVPAIRPCCRYSGLSPEKKEACEHVSFCTCIRSHGGRIVFNPHFRL